MKSKISSMAQNRPDIPADLKRAVLVEAGHRCAIPACRQMPVEIAHIVPWVTVKKHTFDNLIALCPTCHSRYDRGDIDRQSMIQYKANLEILNHRYTDIERQLLKAFLRKLEQMRNRFPNASLSDMRSALQIGHIRIYAEMWWTVSNLLDDGLIEFRAEDLTILKQQEKLLNARVVLLTQKGQEFLTRWAAADPL
ncbi:HNH endonuclease signature motif containing protein [Microbispora rosea]|uniref:HNH endonuclease n=1 Tax=Microbispora rosea TaxID=58117 RepID=UPI0034420470